MRAPEQGKESKIKTMYRMLKGMVVMCYKIQFKKAKIVHIHTASGVTFYRESVFLYLASFLGAKTILHMHSGILKEFYETHPKFVGKCLKKADRVITIANVWERYLKAKGHSNVITIKNPIEVPRPQNKNINQKIQVLILGLVCQNKGIWDILEMVKDHHEEFKNRMKLQVGGNGEVERLINFIHENNLNDVVEYIGWVDEEKKPYILSNTDIYLQPSYKEALGIAILEAMSYKVPIIATNTGGIPEIVQDGKNGYLIEPGDKEELFQMILKLMKSESLRKDFGQEGFMMAQNYYPSAIKAEVISLYDSLLGDK